MGLLSGFSKVGFVENYGLRVLLQFFPLSSGKIRLDNEAKPYIKVTCKTLILIEFLIFLNENG